MKKTFSFLENLSLNQKALSFIDECIKITLGPSGKNALVFSSTQVIQYITSGSTLISSLSFSFSSGNILVKLLEQAAKKTTLMAGDGSTTTLLLSCELLTHSFRFLSTGYNAIFLSNGLKKTAYFLLDMLSIYSSPIENPNSLIGIIKTALGKKVQTNLFSLFQEVIPYLERDGLLLVEENSIPVNQIEKVQGIEIERGFASSYFVNDLKNFQVFYEKPYVLIANCPIRSFEQLQEILDYSKQNHRPLVIIAEEIEKEVLSTLVLNTMKKKIEVSVIKYSAIKFLKTGVLEDVALLTHANYFPTFETSKTKPTEKNESPSGFSSFSSFSIQDLGHAEKVIIKKDKSTFFISKFAKVIANRRINELNRELLESESDYEKNIFKTRMARLAGNITKIKLGNTNDYQLQEVKQKVENLFVTLKSSFEEGCLPGGGSAFLYLKNEVLSWSYLNLVGEEIFATQVLSASLKRPFEELSSFKLSSASVKNPSFSFEESSTLKSTLKKDISILTSGEEMEKLGYPYSYDVVEKKVGNCFQLNLLDSTKSLRAILWNTITLVSTILTSE